MFSKEKQTESVNRVTNRGGRKVSKSQIIGITPNISQTIKKMKMRLITLFQESDFGTKISEIRQEYINLISSLHIDKVANFLNFLEKKTFLEDNVSLFLKQFEEFNKEEADKLKAGNDKLLGDRQNWHKAKNGNELIFKEIGKRSKKFVAVNDLLSEPKVPTTHRVVEKKPTPVIETKSNKKKSKKKKNKNKNKRNNDNDVHTEDA